MAKSDIIANTKTDTSSPDNSSFSTPSGDSDNDTHSRDLDQAYWYMQDSSNRHDAEQMSVGDLKRLRRKIDWRIVPIMFCCYTMQFIDKVLLNVSRRLHHMYQHFISLSRV